MEALYLGEPQGVSSRLHQWLTALDRDYVPAIEVRAFLDAERRDHADDLAAFTDVLVYNALMARAASWRSQLRQRARHDALVGQRRQRTEDAAGNLTEGRPAGLWGSTCMVDDKGTQRPLHAMTGPDHRYVADHYRDDAHRKTMLAAFHEAVAKRCGDKRTDEVFKPEVLDALYRSIVTDAA